MDMKELSVEEKELLLKDLCARFNYGLRIQLTGSKTICSLLGIRRNVIYTNVDSEPFDVEYVKPYLRPMSSITEEEYEEYTELRQNISDKLKDWKCADLIDWLNKHHFDYRGLIEKGLALEAPEGMYER